MTASPSNYYKALKARDNRFDGVFYVGVTSTRIYCRPICPAKTPRAANCRFFPSAEAAEKDNFRPCLRCRPELSPGSAPIDDPGRIASLFLTRMNESFPTQGANLSRISEQFELSSRQLRRIIQQELGVAPIELLQTRRLLLAKQLLTETKLPMTEIAFASGFASVRRFNQLLKTRYRLSPSQVRNHGSKAHGSIRSGDSATLRLGYRPPYDWRELLAFLEGRLLNEAEWIAEGVYRRTVRLGVTTGWIAVRDLSDRNSLEVEFSHSLLPVLPALLGRLRHLFDLDARPDLIGAQLSQSKELSSSLRKYPGLRVPGAFDGFEQAVRAILGQQITVKAATTLACRFIERFGDRIDTPFPRLTYLAPRPETVAAATKTDIARLGIIGSRAETILRLARACQDGTLDLSSGSNAEATMAALTRIPGIGAWTAHYIAMRALGWPDAFPKEDIAIRKALGGVSPSAAEKRSQRWRPWRSYAVLHLWQSLAAPPIKVSAGPPSQQRSRRERSFI